ncbi:ATP-binding protein [sulfur-oxidizing endosymbiont of Gigantopelta aegis]|uniref:ATP-binding protein n=1 Tax=sulfur-oxidizing endosymbiont of Gigantopelta aegis TaxID=2794934 RepID=UPI0018DCA9A8|nr:AAA family ATPase [sulfur-oxidizing endosymbiont of Gigantopelta aegis]
MEFERLIKLSPSKSCFLLGPRGTGKSFWLKQQCVDSVYIDLLDSEHYFRLLAAPEQLNSYIPPNYQGDVIIDEIQRIPALLNEVHRLIEATSIRFILTGSSARKLRKQGVNLLAGRALTYFMYPLTVAELGSQFNLKHSLQYGHLPSLYHESSTDAESSRDYLYSYVSTYLKEEVLQEGLTRNLEAYARFLQVASFSQGETLNITAVARECGLNRKLVESYFIILEDLLLAIRVPVFTKKAKRRLLQHPKFYYFDVGIYRSIRPKGPLDSPEEIDGAALETLFLQELRAINAYHKLAYEIYYWRTADQVEVGFVLYGERGLLAFEVKRKSKYSRNDLKGLKAFIKDYPMVKAYLIYGGKDSFYEGEITVLPMEKALMTLPEILNTGA